MEEIHIGPPRQVWLHKVVFVCCCIAVSAILAGAIWQHLARRSLPCADAAQERWHLSFTESYGGGVDLNWTIHISSAKQARFLQCLAGRGYEVRVHEDTGVIAATKDGRYILNARDGWSGWLLNEQFQTPVRVH